MRKAVIENGTVTNIIVVDPEAIPAWAVDLPEVTEDIGIGWSVSEGGYVPPPIVIQLPPVPQTLSFAQFLVGLVEQGWVTEAEAQGWLSANSLPAAVEFAIGTMPETAPDGSKPQLRARARALRPSEISRHNELLLMMAQARGATPEDLDNFFRLYATI